MKCYNLKIVTSSNHLEMTFLRMKFIKLLPSVMRFPYFAVYTVVRRKSNFNHECFEVCKVYIKSKPLRNSKIILFEIVTPESHFLTCHTLHYKLSSLIRCVDNPYSQKLTIVTLQLETHQFVAVYSVFKQVSVKSSTSCEPIHSVYSDLHCCIEVLGKSCNLHCG